jgi:hypothetical protein
MGEKKEMVNCGGKKYIRVLTVMEECERFFITGPGGLFRDVILFFVVKNWIDLN